VNIPNLLTLSRFFLSGLMLVFLLSAWPYAKTAALIAFAAASITDALDGYLARRVYGSTAFGSLMDPLADKVMICCALVGFVQLHLIPVWIVVLILSREFLVTGLRVLVGTQGRIVPAGAWGKHKTAWQIILIVMVLARLSLYEDWSPLLFTGNGLLAGQVDIWFDTLTYLIAIGAALITMASGVLYFHEHRNLITEHLNKPGVRAGGSTS